MCVFERYVDSDMSLVLTSLSPLHLSLNITEQWYSLGEVLRNLEQTLNGKYLQ